MVVEERSNSINFEGKGADDGNLEVGAAGWASMPGMR
jgi:hypothetical protein